MMGAEWFLGAIVFLVGLCAGSFLNVCIYRIPLEKSVVLPPSSCPECGEKLKAGDLIPVASYIFLGGKCRYCKAGISLRYPLVELLTGLTWIFIYIKFGLTFEAVALIFFFSILIPVFFIDLDHMIIPNGLVLAGIAGGIPVVLYNAFIKPYSLFEPRAWYTPLIGAVSASGILFLVALLGLLIYKNDGAMGMGDVKLFVPIGLFLGWKLALLTLFISVMLGGIVSIFLLLFRIKDRKSAIPFGPFIILAAFISANYGNIILNYLSWYYNL